MKEGEIMPIYPVINAPNVKKDAIVVGMKILEALVAHYGTPHFVIEQTKGKMHFTFLQYCRPVIAYEK